MLDENLGVVDGGLDLGAVTDDARIGDKALDVVVAVGSDLGRVETVEGTPVVLALLENGDPGESRLRALENYFLEQAPPIAVGRTPFLVVIVKVEWVEGRPGATIRLVHSVMVVSHRYSSLPLQTNAASSPTDS